MAQKVPGMDVILFGTGNYFHKRDIKTLPNKQFHPYWRDKHITQDEANRIALQENISSLEKLGELTLDLARQSCYTFKQKPLHRTRGASWEQEPRLSDKSNRLRYVVMHHYRIFRANTGLSLWIFLFISHAQAVATICYSAYLRAGMPMRVVMRLRGGTQNSMLPLAHWGQMERNEPKNHSWAQQ